MYAKVFQSGLLVAACLIFASTTGCSAMRIYLGPDFRTGSPQPEPIGVVYQLDAARLNETLAVARIEGQAVSYDEVYGSPLSDRTVGTLSVIYPHSEASPEFARAEVRIDARPTPELPQLGQRATELLPWYRHGAASARDASDTAHEVWQLDVPRVELDQLLAHLATPRTVTAGGSNPGAQIKMSYNDQHYQTGCQPVPQLDALMQRVRREGRLVSYARPLTARAQHLEKTSAVLAYREMHSHGASEPEDSYVAAPYQGQPLLARSGLAAPRFEDASRVVFLPSTGGAGDRR